MVSSELAAAIQAVEEKTGETLEEATADQLIDKIADKKTGMEFTDALRYSLNECRLSGERRNLYRKLAGVYFGRRGGRKAAQNRHSKKPVAPKATKPATLQVKEEKGGQYAFLV